MIFTPFFSEGLINALLLLHGLRPIEIKVHLERRLGNIPTKSFHRLLDMNRMNGSGSSARKVLL
jgi:hypothetical protein